MQLTYKDYKDALFEDIKKSTKNTSIRTRNDHMYTMTTEKTGLSNVFTKALVLSDRVTIKPFPKLL